MSSYADIEVGNVSRFQFEFATKVLSKDHRRIAHQSSSFVKL